MGLLYERKYCRLIVGSLFIALFFGGAFIAVVIFSLSLLEDSADTLLAKISMMASVCGVFLGTYIALWLINQNRTKRIEESYFYRIQIIPFISATLRKVNEINEKIADSKNKNTYNSNFWKIIFDNYEHLIALINSNTSIPAHIRTNVNILRIEIYLFITASLDKQESIMLSLSEYNDSVFNSKFFTTHTDEAIRTNLEKLNDEWSKIKKNTSSST